MSNVNEPVMIISKEYFINENLSKLEREIFKIENALFCIKKEICDAKFDVATLREEVINSNNEIYKLNENQQIKLQNIYDTNSTILEFVESIRLLTHFSNDEIKQMLEKKGNE